MASIEHDITDRRTAIGPEPADYRDAVTWRRVVETIDDAREIIHPHKAVPELKPRTIEGPSLEIGF